MLYRNLTDDLDFKLEDIKLDNLETNHFVLVHGGGFGAWYWYKTIALLEEAGYRATMIDLTGSGIHSFDPNSITDLSQYVQPLTDVLEKLPTGEKVLSFPDINDFVDLDLNAGSNDVMRQAQVFVYSNSNDNPPTAIELKRMELRDVVAV
ncbi:putative methylesterase 11, chloroplastic [Benincasa hispida]|uniref:putative methylesterase 11, chloroplastic n=1 Tax=Benincasa hispida TaxID=102211 RepID=UPI001901A6A5|nr:putative methylesterase 11, chloroplastic [Benincasa hispida]